MDTRNRPDSALAHQSRARFDVRSALRRMSFGTIGVYALATLVSIVSVYPFLYAISTSFKTGTALFDPGLWPKDPTLHNYVGLFEGTQPFGRQILNSVMVSTTVVVISLFLSVTAAYAIGRISFKGRGLLLMAILSVSMFPQVAVLGGMFELIQAMGLYNLAIGLVVPYMIFTLPFTVWVLTTFMRQLPKELEEAAVMDGCGPWRTIWSVFMPLLWPAVVSTTLLAFIHAWNEFLFALTFVVKDSQRTVPVGISLISGATAYEIPWGSIMAASVIVTVPLILMVLVFQKKIVSGLTAGAVKG
jgi:trehalose/maltose transport system permease protein